jgi:hypothetical protein
MVNCKAIAAPDGVLKRSRLSVRVPAKSAVGTDLPIKMGATNANSVGPNVGSGLLRSHLARRHVNI